MKKLFRCELLLVWKKFILLAILGAIASSFIFIFEYEQKGKEYIPKQVERNEVAMSAYKSEIFLLTNLPKEEQNIHKEYKSFLLNQNSSLSILNMYYKHQDKYSNKIIPLENEIDLHIKEWEKKGYSFDVLLTRGTSSELDQRLSLAKEYKSRGITQPINPISPTLCFVVFDALNGFTFFVIITFVLIVLGSSSIWSREFENKTHYILMTLPFARNRIYFCRCFIFTLGTIFIGLINISTIMILGVLLNGVGESQIVFMNSNINTLKWDFDVVSKYVFIIKPIICEIVLWLLSLTCFFSLIQYVSILFKDLMNTQVVLYSILIFEIIILNLYADISFFIPTMQIGIKNLNKPLYFSFFLTTVLTITTFSLGDKIFSKKDG